MGSFYFCGYTLIYLQMTGLPQLRMLSVCDNDLDSLTGMPYLPKLEVFQFAGNPKLHERADFLTVVALACSSSLKRICSDQNPAPQLIPSEVHDIVSQYPTYAGDCVRLGWDIPSATEIAEGADVGKLADAFLIGVQQAALPHGWYREAANRPWREIPKATSRSYVPCDGDLQCRLKVMCYVDLPGFPPLFALSPKLVEI
eukprot:gene2375-3103_t